MEDPALAVHNLGELREGLHAVVCAGLGDRLPDARRLLAVKA